jgi:hypothetical protein
MPPFRGPGVSFAAASLFRSLIIDWETRFEIHVEALNLTNHALLNGIQGTTVGSSTSRMITSFVPPLSPTQGARSLRFGDRYDF